MKAAIFLGSMATGIVLWSIPVIRWYKTHNALDKKPWWVEYYDYLTK
jgi:hypothetical protein